MRVDRSGPMWGPTAREARAARSRIGGERKMGQERVLNGQHSTLVTKLFSNKIGRKSDKPWPMRAPLAAAPALALHAARALVGRRRRHREQVEAGDVAPHCRPRSTYAITSRGAS